MTWGRILFLCFVAAVFVAFVIHWHTLMQRD